MTEPESALEPAEDPPPTEAPAARTRVPWTAFLNPAAILLGALIIAAAIWYTDDGPHPAETLPLVALAGAESTAPPTTAPVSSAQTLLTAFNGYARQLSLDATKFQQCLSNQAHVQLLNTQLQLGSSLGVNGTPTFFVNNKRIVGSQPAFVFEEVINAELKGSPTTIDGYSASVKTLASSNPPRFEILATAPDTTGAQFQGNPNAKVIVLEFSDFQCPFCKRWGDDYLTTLRKRLGDDVALGFMHFPIAQLHPNAGNASVAAICAAEQGKFWEMHDILFARQQEWASLKN